MDLVVTGDDEGNQIESKKEYTTLQEDVKNRLLREYTQRNESIMRTNTVK